MTERFHHEELNEHDWLALIDRWLHGEADESQCALLHKLIINNDEIRKLAASNMLVDFLLTRKYETLRKEQSVFANFFEEQMGTDSVPIVVPCYIDEEKRNIFPRIFEWYNESSGSKCRTKFVRGFSLKEQKRRRFWPMMFLVLTVVTLLATGIGVWISLPDYDVEEEFDAVAKVVETIDTQWEAGSTSLRRGQDSGPNQLKLIAGLVKLRFVNGTELTLTGPTDLTINGSFDTFCLHGKISAQVPPSGHGFKVVTPHGSAMDCGTKFFIEVDSQQMELGVVQGQVNLFRTAEKTSDPEKLKNVLSLSTGEAVRKSLDVPASSVKFSPEKYIDEPHFQRLLSDYADKEEAKRIAADRRINSDSGLLVRFDFSQDQGNRVINRSQRQTGCSELQVSQTKTTEGSFHGRHAIQFGSGRGRGNLTLPGTWRSMTLFARIRIDKLENWSNVLFAAGEADTPGSFVWQISKTGQLYFLIREKSSSRGVPLSSDPVFTRRFWGGWYTVAVTVDADRKTITHYVDGKPVKSFPWIEPVPLVVGSATIGNGSKTDRSSNSRALKAAMEDFRVYDRVLTPEELLEYAK